MSKVICRILLVTCLIGFSFLLLNKSWASLPNGYEGAKWGMTPEQIMGIISKYQLASGCTPVYEWGMIKIIFDRERTKDERESIAYQFSDDKLFKVSVEFSSGAVGGLEDLFSNTNLQSRKKIMGTLRRKYGSPKVYRRKYWIGDCECYETIWRDVNNEIIYEEKYPPAAGVWLNYVTYGSRKIYND